MNLIIRNKGFISRFLIITLGILVILNAFVFMKVNALDATLQDMNARVEENGKDLSEHGKAVNTLKAAQSKVEAKLKQKNDHEYAISQIRNNGYSANTDLSTNNASAQLTADDMNKIIDYWIDQKGVSSEFKGHGQAFIDASKSTGMNPIYILAHAAIESGWGSSHLAKTRHNYFGINAVDHNPGLAYSMGDDMAEGLISGADWIRRNFYNNGYTTLAMMKAGNYATDPHWEGNILHVMNESARVL